MKTCAACCIELPRDRFSKKQWNMNQRQRRCTVCIDSNRVCTLFDKALFKQPPRKEDCPICFLRLPSLQTGSKYSACCGKMICTGCMYAVARLDKEEKCPFCRVPAPNSNKEGIKQVKKRVEMVDAQAMYNIGRWYYKGLLGLPQDYSKALELWHRAGELGCAIAYNNIGVAYSNGRGLERDEKKALHYWELAAMSGDVCARHNLGLFEMEGSGNIDRALKHFMIAVEYGCDKSLVHIKQLYMTGNATKDDYAKALRSHQAYLNEIKSDQRNEAAVLYWFGYY